VADEYAHLSREELISRLQARAATAGEVERYRSLIEQAADGIFITDAAGTYLEVNASGARMLGLTQQEIVGRRIRDFVIPEDQPDLAASLMDVGIGATIVRERRFRRVDGTVFPGEVIAKKLADGRYQGVVRDLTERKRAEQARQDSEARYRQIVELSHDGIWATDTQQNTTFVNPRITEMLGYSAAAMMGRPFSSFLFPGDLNEHWEKTRQRRLGGSDQYERRLRRKDGSALWTIISVQALLDANGVFQGAFGVLTDITDRKRAEDAAHEATERLHEIFEYTSEGIFVLRVTPDSQFVMETTNPANEKLIGLSREQVQGLRPEVFLPPQTAREVIANYRRCLETDGPIDYEETLEMPVGRRTFHTYLVPIRDAAGRIHRIAGFARDITGRKSAEQALRESEEKFSKAFRASPDACCLIELASSRYLEVNDGFLRITGYSRAEVIGHTALELGLWGRPEDRVRMIGLLNAHGTLRDAQTFFRRKDDRVIICLIAAELVEINGQTAILAVVRDITEQLRTDQSRRELEEKFTKVFRTSPDPIILSDFQTGRLIEVNDSYLRTYGCTRDDVIGHTTFELDRWTNPADRTRMMGRLQAQGSVHGFEVTTRTPDGMAVALLLSAEMIELGGSLCVLTIAHNITDRKRAESDRARALEREQQAREEFTRQLLASQEAERRRIAGELHDSLGQNLLLIKNHAQLALASPAYPPDLRWQIESINDMAAQAIVEVRQISHDLRPYQLDQLGFTQALKTMLEATGRNTGFQVTHKLDNIDDLLSADAATNLYRIAQECLNNILKHARARNARVLLERDIRQVRLHIEDDGGGFDPAAPGPGGFGLRNMAERVRILGGTLAIDSARGHGTRIEITLPVPEEACNPGDASRSP